MRPLRDSEIASQYAHITARGVDWPEDVPEELADPCEPWCTADPERHPTVGCVEPSWLPDGAQPGPRAVAYLIAAVCLCAAIGVGAVQNHRCSEWAGDDPQRVAACEELAR